MSDLVERLRKYAASEELRGYIMPNWGAPLGEIPKGNRLIDDLREAADALERAERERDDAREIGGKARMDYRGNLETLWLVVMERGGEMVVPYDPKQRHDISRLVVFTTYEAGQLRLRARMVPESHVLSRADGMQEQSRPSSDQD